VVDCSRIRTDEGARGLGSEPRGCVVGCLFEARLRGPLFIFVLGYRAASRLGRTGLCRSKKLHVDLLEDHISMR
jgi:hypothetical protein